MQPPASLFQTPAPQQQPTVTADLSAILSAFQPQVQQPQQQQQPPQQIPAVTNDFMASLQAITRQVAAQAQAQQAPQPPQFAQQPQPQQPVQQSTPDISSILAALGGVNSGQLQTQQQANNTFLQNLVQQNPTVQSAALGNALAQLGMPLLPTLGSYSQPAPGPAGYETPATQKGWSYESQVQQAYGSNPVNNNANQSGWNGSGGTDEFGRALRDGEKEKEGRSVADIRRETKEKGGVWDERNIETEQPTGGGRAGGGNTGGGRGAGWGGKHKKVNY